jgi:hypothetical protein
LKKALLSTVTAALLLIVLPSPAFAAPSAAQVATRLRLETKVQHAETFTATGNVSGTAAHPGNYTLRYLIEVDRVTRASAIGTATFTADSGDSDGNS